MNKTEIHEAIKNYRWMMNLLISKRLEATGGSDSLIAKYGIEATMPKPQGDPSDPVLKEILRLEKYQKNTRKVRRKIMLIQRHSKAVTNTRDQLILDELLNGLTLREIASEMDMSLTAVKRRKDVIVSLIHRSVQTEQTEQMEQKEKIR